MDNISKMPLDFKPGSKWNYSNSGYYLLGYIISKVTGMPYQQAVTERILKPLGMNNSGFWFKNVRSENKTTGYEFLSKQHFSSAISYDYDHPYAAGAMYSTAGDFFKFYKGLKNGDVLKKEIFEKAITPFKEPHYGYGFVIEPVFGHKTIGHSGAGPGYFSNFSWMPDEDICITILSNVNMYGIGTLTNDLYAIMLGKPHKTTSHPVISKQQLDAITGIYTSPDSNFYISGKDGIPKFFESKYNASNYLVGYDNYTLCFPVPNGNIYFKFIPSVNGKIESLELSFPEGTQKKAKKISNTLRWGIVGSGTANGWDAPDISLITDPKMKKVLFAKNVPLKKGEIKFRTNNEWALEYGLDDNGELIQYGKSIPVEEGVYDIYLDFKNEITPSYRIIKSK